MSSRALDEEDISIRFVNTVAWRRRSPPEERLGSADALRDWLALNGASAPFELSGLRHRWTFSEDEGARALQTARKLREAIYRLFIAHVALQQPASADLVFVSEFLWRRPSALRLVWNGQGLSWQRAAGEPDVLDFLRPIALSAVALLTGARARKLRQCQDAGGCGWLFIDESRQQNRRWCSMGDCGNRAKAHRHRQRTHLKDGQ